MCVWCICVCCVCMSVIYTYDVYVTYICVCVKCVLIHTHHTYTKVLVLWNLYYFIFSVTNSTTPFLLVTDVCTSFYWLITVFKKQHWSVLWLISQVISFKCVSTRLSGTGIMCQHNPQLHWLLKTITKWLVKLCIDKPSEHFIFCPSTYRLLIPCLWL